LITPFAVLGTLMARLMIVCDKVATWARHRHGTMLTMLSL
jgi:hypothetical protein